MTTEDIQQKAEENCKKNVCGWYDYCKDCINKDHRRIKDMCYPAKWVIQAYINGYKQGQNDNRRKN